MVIADREALHRVIDELPPESLEQLADYIAYLQFKQERQKGTPWAKEYYDIFAPVREAVVKSGMTDEEIDEIIDTTIEEVRRERRG